MVARTAQRFLAERHVSNRPCRFDVLAIDNHLGHSPEVCLHKDAFSAQL
jgi:Holliday junction resolvase-like predicted endonuclease